MERVAGVLAWLLFAAAVGYLGYGPDRSESTLLLTGFAVALAAYIPIALRMHLSVGRLVLLAMVLRASLFLAPITWTDDHYRYIWDGICSSHGISPFAHTPDELLKTDPQVFTQELHDQLNSPHFYSVYPPVAQTAFFLAAKLGNGDTQVSVFALRAIVLGCELLTLLALASLLKGRRDSEVLIALYALNPLVLMEFTVNLHTEAMMLPFSLWAIVAAQRGLGKRAGVLLGFAASVKILPVLFLGWLPIKFGTKRAIVPIAIATLVFLASWAPFRTPELVPNFLSSLKLYASHLELNGPVFELLRATLGDGPVKGTGLLPAFTLVALLVFTVRAVRRRSISFPNAMLWLLTIYFFGSQVVHPWYIVPLIAFGLAGGWYWPVAWSLLIMPTYLTYGHIPFAQPYWWLPIEYGLLAVAIYCEWRFAPWRKIGAETRAQWGVREQ